MEKGACFRSELTGVEGFNVELWPGRVIVHHILGTRPVALKQVLNAMYRPALEEVFDPCATPSEQAVSWAFTMLFSLEVNRHLGAADFLGVK